MIRYHLWRACWRSATVTVSYVMLAGGVVMELLSSVPDVAASVGLMQIVPPKYLGTYTVAMGVITLAARMRSIILHRFYPEHRDDA